VFPCSPRENERDVLSNDAMTSHAVRDDKKVTSIGTVLNSPLRYARLLDLQSFEQNGDQERILVDSADPTSVSQAETSHGNRFVAIDQR
jgi:hypothetical protein